MLRPIEGPKKSRRAAKVKRRNELREATRQVVEVATAPEALQSLPPPPDRNREQRSPQERLRLEFAIANLAAVNYSAKDIAERLNVPQCTVQRYLNNLEAHFRERAAELVNIARGRQATRIHGLLEECFEALKASKLPAKSRTVEAVRPGTNASGSPTTGGRAGKVLERTEERYADMGVIQTANSLLHREAKLLGLDAPQELRMVLETLDEGKRNLLDAVKRNVKDPAVLKAIAEDLAGQGEERSDSMALVDAEEIDDYDIRQRTTGEEPEEINDRGEATFNDRG